MRHVYLWDGGIRLPADQAAAHCENVRDACIRVARQYRDVDLPWFKAHDPAEYDMQIRRDVVALEVAKARKWNWYAVHCRRLVSPIQATLL